MPDANMHMDKRVYPRVTVKVPIQYSLVENPEEVQKLKDQLANTVDISLGGMAISLDQPLERGTLLRVSVSLPSEPKPLVFFAEVVWINPNGAGLQFVMVKSKDIETLQNYLDRASSIPS